MSTEVSVWKLTEKGEDVGRTSHDKGTSCLWRLHFWFNDGLMIVSMCHFCGV